MDSPTRVSRCPDTASKPIDTSSNVSTVEPHGNTPPKGDTSTGGSSDQSFISDGSKDETIVPIYQRINIGASDVSSADGDGNTLLHVACLKGLSGMVKVLLDRGCDPAARNRLGQTPLHIAIDLGYTEIAKALIEKIADPTTLNAPDKNRNTPLHLACLKGLPGTVQDLLDRGCDPAARNRLGQTPLHIAIDLGYTEIAKALIEKIADPTTLNAPDKSGNTPLHLACLKGDISSTIALLRHEVSVDAENCLGQTPLHHALLGGTATIINELIETASNVDTPDDTDVRPLHLACLKGLPGTVQYLLDRDCDPAARNRLGQTPLHIAIDLGYTEIAKALIKKLSADVVALNAPDINRNTPLHLACLTGDASIFDLLIKDMPSGVDAENCLGQTPLHLALHGGNDMVIRPLTETASNANANNVYVGNNGNGNTPLHVACREGRISKVSELLQSNCNIFAVNSQGETVLHLAAAGGHATIISLLLRHLMYKEQAYWLGNKRNEIFRLGDIDGLSALHLAARSGNEAACRLLIKAGYVANLADCDIEVVIRIASRKGLTDVSQMLIDEKAKPTLGIKYGTPYDYTNWHRHSDIAEYLQSSEN